MGYQALLFCPDERTARTVTQVLHDLDFAVEPCTEPFAAVKKLMAQHFDAVVVDCDNEQNATLLFKSARTSNSNQSSLAVAVVEGQAGVAKAFRIGANLVLTRPINVEQAKGTLRVARGLLRKGGGEAPKATAPQGPAVSQDAGTSKTRASRPTTSTGPATPSFAPGFVSRKPSIPATPTQQLSPAIPSMAASADVADVHDPDSDAILEDDTLEPTSGPPSFEAKPTVQTAAAPPAATATSKFPWQPWAKMAEPMASALRRAAEAAGQIEPVDTEPAKPAVAPTAPEKQPMTGAMFQAQGHAATPMRAREKAPLAASSASTIEVAAGVSKTAVREVSPPKKETSVVVDTVRDGAPPPTFFPGAYDAHEIAGGGKTKAIVIVAAVVLLASSAGYLSWKNGRDKDAAPSAATQSLAAATSAMDATNAPDSATPNSEPVATDITIAGAGMNASAAARPKPSPAVPNADKATASAKARASQTPESDEPEVTQRLIVKNDTRHMTSASNPQDQETVQAPSAIGVTNGADTKALAGISSAPVNVPHALPQMLRVSQGVMEGLVLKRVQPRYPTQALQMRIQGPVQLQATISKTGDIENLKVVSGDALLARAAQEAVKQWKYKPYYLNGEPVQIETQILVNFKLPN